MDKIYKRISELMGREVASEFKDDETMSVEIEQEEDAFFPELKSLTVPYSERGRGLGRKLLAATCQALKEAGHDRVGLYAFPYSYGKGNTLEDIKKLVRWYEQQGFVLNAEDDLDDLDDLDDKDELLSFEQVQTAIWMEKAL